MPLEVSELKKISCDAIDKELEELNTLSQDLWNKPELAFEEKYAHELLSTFLEKRSFPTERHYLLDTAFRSVVDCGPGPNVSICCEYDALPEIGHACGHNLIAEAGVGASIGVKAALDAAKQAGQDMGKVRYVCTRTLSNCNIINIISVLRLLNTFYYVYTNITCLICS